MAKKELRKAAFAGSLGSIIENTATLRTRLAVSEDRARQLRDSIQSFRVLPEYRSLEKEASDITRQLQDLSNGNTIDRQLLSDLRTSFSGEEDGTSSFTEVENLYREAGVVLPDSVTRRFEEVREFHRSIIENRKSYLNTEMEAAEFRMAKRQEEMSHLDGRRSEIIGVLRSHEALDQLVKLQSELSRIEGDIEATRKQFEAAEKLESQKTELDIKRQRLLVRLRQDYREQREQLNDAILAFEETSSSLYENAGNLTIEDSIKGPKFEITIQGAKSKGISNMQIFCFDMIWDTSIKLTGESAWLSRHPGA